MAGQDPAQGAEISEQQLRARMALIAPYTQSVRTYGVTHGLEAAGRVAHELGLKVAVQAWLGRPDVPGNENDLQIANLIAAGQAQEAYLLRSCSVVISPPISVSDISERRSRRCRAWPSRPRTPDALEQHPAVISEIDVVLTDIYPFWAGVALVGAVPSLSQQYERAQKLAENKPVMIGETGWPSCGAANGNALASPETAARYLRDFVAWARANNLRYFYFEAFDEDRKAKHEGERGACWGILDRDGRLKLGMHEVFR